MTTCGAYIESQFGATQICGERGWVCDSCQINNLTAKVEALREVRDQMREPAEREPRSLLAYFYGRINAVLAASGGGEV